jgi:hypothetical protein
MRILLFLVILVTPVWAALTPEQEALLRQCYLSDASARGKDADAQVQELIGFILASRAAQKTQLTNLVQRCRDRITDNQNTITADQAAALAALNASGTATDGTLTAIPTLP